MKKTIITLMALAGVAAADVADLTIQDKAITLSNEMLELTLTSIAGASSTGGTYAPDEVTGAEGFSPKIQFVQNNNEDCYWMLTFTLENKSEKDICIDGLGLTMQSTTSTGGNHTAGIGVVTNTLTIGGAEYTGTLTLGANSASGTGVITTNYTLAAGAIEEVSLKVQRTKAGALTGFAAVTAGTLSYTVVPEPATATLSLLALAGLAARRRRK